MIKIDFEFQTPHGKFADALHLPENHGLSEAEIQAMKEQRRDNWIAIVTAPPVEQPETTKEIGGEVYQKLEGVPPAGAKLVEVEGVWYYKV
jgi:hypothetical protein